MLSCAPRSAVTTSIGSTVHQTCADSVFIKTEMPGERRRAAMAINRIMPGANVRDAACKIIMYAELRERKLLGSPRELRNEQGVSIITLLQILSSLQSY